MMQLKFEVGDNKEYKVESIKDSIIYVRELDGHLLGLYYLLFWKGYPEKKNIWEPVSAVQYLWKLIKNVYIEYSDNLIATFSLINVALPIVKLNIKPTKQSITTLPKPLKL